MDEKLKTLKHNCDNASKAFAAACDATEAAFKAINSAKETYNEALVDVFNKAVANTKTWDEFKSACDSVKIDLPYRDGVGYYENLAGYVYYDRAWQISTEIAPDDGNLNYDKRERIMNRSGPVNATTVDIHELKGGDIRIALFMFPVWPTFSGLIFARRARRGRFHTCTPEQIAEIQGGVVKVVQRLGAVATAYDVTLFGNRYCSADAK